MRLRGPEGPQLGFYVMRWGGGRYGSCAWFSTLEEAIKERNRMIASGYWSGKAPAIEEAYRSGFREVVSGK